MDKLKFVLIVMPFWLFASEGVWDNVDVPSDSEAKTVIWEYATEQSVKDAERKRVEAIEQAEKARVENEARIKAITKGVSAFTSGVSKFFDDTYLGISIGYCSTDYLYSYTSHYYDLTKSDTVETKTFHGSGLNVGLIWNYNNYKNFDFMKHEVPWGMRIEIDSLGNALDSVDWLFMQIGAMGNVRGVYAAPFVGVNFHNYLRLGYDFLSDGFIVSSEIPIFKNIYLSAKAHEARYYDYDYDDLYSVSYTRKREYFEYFFSLQWKFANKDGGIFK